MGLQGIPSHLFNTETVSFVRWAALRLYLLFLHHTTVEVTPAAQRGSRARHPLAC